MGLMQRTLWPRVNITDAERDQLLQLMHVATATNPSARDAFDFVGNRLVGRIDARRGESEFFLAEFMDENLLDSEFDYDEAGALGEPDTYYDYMHGDQPNRNHLIRRVYLCDGRAVSVTTEVSDRGRHRYFVVSLFLTEHRLFQ